MTDTLSLEHLYDDVIARFAADAAAADPVVAPVPNLFGWRKPAEQSLTSHRIVWVPGDDESGDVGELGPARWPGRNPRPLATLGELFTVYIEAVDVTAHQNERAQWKAARLLFDAWWRAVHLAAHGTVAMQSARWMNDRVTARLGATLRVLCRVDAMVPDQARVIAPTDTTALLDVEELDHTEQIAVDPADA